MYKFFTAVLRNEFNRHRWQPIVSILRRINRTFEVILGSGVVALLIYLIYSRVPIMENKRWTAIVVLACLVLFATWLLAAAKRFHESTLSQVTTTHERTLSEVKTLHEGVIAEMNTSQEQTSHNLDHVARLIEHLTLLEGRSDALYFLLENRSWNDHPLAGIVFHKDEIRYHEADIFNTFRDRLGSAAVEEYFQRLGPITDKLYEQKARIEAHRHKLHELLQSARAQRREIAVKAARQKQATINLTEG